MYYLNLNGAEAGPFSLRQLGAMWLTGGITVNTEWRVAGAGHVNWRSGDKLLEMLEGKSKVEPRSIVRESTEYPWLRFVLEKLVFVNLIAAAVFLVLIVLDGKLEWGLASLVAVLGLIPLALANAILDIADASLKKL